MTTDRSPASRTILIASLLAGIVLAASLDDLKPLGYVMLAIGVWSLVASALLRLRPEWAGAALGRSPVGAALEGLSCLGMGLGLARLVTGPAEIVTASLTIAALLFRVVVNRRSRDRIPREAA